jgi:hypothetical protein
VAKVPTSVETTTWPEDSISSGRGVLDALNWPAEVEFAGGIGGPGGIRTPNQGIMSPLL